MLNLKHANLRTGKGLDESPNFLLSKYIIKSSTNSRYCREATKSRPTAFMHTQMNFGTPRLPTKVLLGARHPTYPDYAAIAPGV